MTLEQFFQENPRCALGFSGGVDSAYLLYAGVKAGADIRPYFIKTAFQPAFELADARKLAAGLGAEVTVLELDALADPRVAANPADRCYFCKQNLFRTLKERAIADGYPVLLDGTNASDEAGDRPGMRALAELSVRSPLRECGLTKAEIRARSREAGLFTWDKPAYACLATRIPAGEVLTGEKLHATEEAEAYLSSLGFTDFRIRSHAAHFSLVGGGCRTVRLAGGTPDIILYVPVLQGYAGIQGVVPGIEDVGGKSEVAVVACLRFERRSTHFDAVSGTEKLLARWQTVRMLIRGFQLQISGNEPSGCNTCSPVGKRAPVMPVVCSTFRVYVCFKIVQVVFYEG